MATTLLDIVQELLSDTDSDNVNSISDTVESDQYARIVRSIFNDVVDNEDIAYHKELTQLEATSSSTPNVMSRPEGLFDIEWVKYNKKLTLGGDQKFETIWYMEPKEFIERASHRAVSDSNVEEVTLTNGHVMPVRNDVGPTYWTVLDGSNDIVFDSYDSDLDTNLQQSKSLVYGKQKPTLTLADSSTLELPENLVSVVRNRARAFIFDVYKDGVTREVDKRARMSDTRLKRQRHITRNQSVINHNTGPNYGRK